MFCVGIGKRNNTIHWLFLPGYLLIHKKIRYVNLWNKQKCMLLFNIFLNSWITCNNYVKLLLLTHVTHMNRMLINVLYVETFTQIFYSLNLTLQKQDDPMEAVICYHWHWKYDKHKAVLPIILTFPEIQTTTAALIEGYR